MKVITFIKTLHATLFIYNKKAFVIAMSGKKTCSLVFVFKVNILNVIVVVFN